MSSPEQYPLYVGPEHLALKSREDWNAKEAKEYRDWLLGILDERVEGLLKRLGETWSESPAIQLRVVGEKAAALLKREPYSEEAPTGRELTDTGLALAADLGLLVAKYLLRTHPDKLKWVIRRKGKREVTYNLPVITGFPIDYNDHLDPIGVSISNAWAVLRNQQDSGVWARLYEHCEKDL